jgi:hypothetical protein
MRDRSVCQQVVAFCLCVILRLFALGMLLPGIAHSQDDILERGSIDLDLRQYEGIYIDALDHGVAHQMAQMLGEELATLYGVHLQIHVGLPKRQHRAILIGRPLVTQMGLADTSEFEAVKWDGYLIKADAHRIAIAGYAPQGTIYGTYAFLRKIGLKLYPWRFGDGLKRYEPIPSGTMPAFSIADKPFFELRDVTGHGRGRYGATMRAYTLGELKWARSLPALKDGGYIGWDHTAGYLVPIQTHMAAHPEFYPTRSGVKILPTTPTKRVGVCACHPALEAITIKNALAWMGRQPARRLFGITDGDQGGSRCPSCAATDPIPDYYTDRNLRWANSVARAIRNPYPDNRVFTLAYLNTVKPPLEAGLEPNALVLYAPWYWSSRATSAVGFDHPLNVVAMEEFVAWNRLFPGQIGVYDYPSSWIYGTAERIKLYARYGVRWVYMNALKGDLLHWVASQLLWDPTLDVDDLIAEFVAAYYGPAADAMQAYYTLRRDTIQRNALSLSHGFAFFKDQAFLHQARPLLERAKQQTVDAESQTRLRVLNSISNDLYEVLQIELRMQMEPQTLRHDFDLYLQWREQIGESCDRISCSQHQQTAHIAVFKKHLKKLSLPGVTLTSTSKADWRRATEQARHQFDQYLHNRAAVNIQRSSTPPARHTLTFVGLDEARQWQTWASDERLSTSIKKQSLVGLDGSALQGVGATLPLSQLPTATRGRLRVHAGHFQLRRRFEPALDGRGQRYLNLHLQVSHAVPVTLYINEKSALRSDINLYPGEQIVRIDLHNFSRPRHKVTEVPSIASITLDVWPQDLFYPYPETRDIDLLLLGLTLDSTPPTPNVLPYPGKVIWLSHFRPNVPHAGSGVGSTAVGLTYMPGSRGERFRSSTPHRVLSPIAAIVLNPSDPSVEMQTALSLQRHLKAAYGIELPVLKRSRAQEPSYLNNAFFLGSLATLAHDQVSSNDLDDIGHGGFVIRARNGAIAIAGHTESETRRGVAAYLDRHGIRFAAKTMFPSLPSPKKSLFLHELFLIGTPPASSPH